MKQEIKRRIEEIKNGVVPQGYKKTKIGIVPDSWNVVKLSSISKHKTQKNISNEFMTHQFETLVGRILKTNRNQTFFQESYC